MLNKILFFTFSFSLALASQEIDLSKISPVDLALAKESLESSSTSSLEDIYRADSMGDFPEKTGIEIVDSNLIEGEKFGYGFITTLPPSITSVADIPLPNDYKVSIRDQFTIILSGSKEAIFDLSVKLDGTIVFPEIGSVSVAGESFSDVKEKLSNLINQLYIGVTVDISIKNLSAKKVTIVGAVKKPGTYLVNPFTTISSALAYSGGVSEMGTLRKIKLIRSDGESFFFDLYDLLIYGDRSNDITLEAGDTILVNAASQFVRLNGAVNRPAIYEVTESEDIKKLIEFALGFKNTANKTNISLEYLDIENSSISQKEISSLEESLLNVTAVDVFEYQNKDKFNVLVRGAISQPGYYDLKDNKNLEELISSIEFIDVYPWLAILEQFDEENLLNEIHLFNLNDETTYESIELRKNSKVYFANLADREYLADELTQALIDDYSLTINHYQGTYVLPTTGRFSPKSLIELLGLDTLNIPNSAIYVAPLKNIVEEKTLDEMRYEASRFHTLNLKAPSSSLIEVEISGAVEFPGIYSINAYSTMDDIYKMVGSFKAGAFLNGVILQRESVRIQQVKAIEKAKSDLNEALLINSQKGLETSLGIESVSSIIAIDDESLGRVAGNFNPSNSNNANFILYDGDKITVPTIPNTISVIGEVLNPSNFVFQEGISVREAIAFAGGEKEFSNSRKIYVIKANGLVERVNRNVFMGNSNLSPGDTIVVPRKINISNPGLELLVPLTNTLSSLAFSAAALDNLRND
tara:strand:- start:2492 stop:4750 length:2259 start_codon:yes stop_codon:yes gene_type:complete